MFLLGNFRSINCLNQLIKKVFPSVASLQVRNTGPDSFQVESLLSPHREVLSLQNPCDLQDECEDFLEALYKSIQFQLKTNLNSVLSNQLFSSEGLIQQAKDESSLDQITSLALWIQFYDLLFHGNLSPGEVKQRVLGCLEYVAGQQGRFKRVVRKSLIIDLITQSDMLTHYEGRRPALNSKSERVSSESFEHLKMLKYFNTNEDVHIELSLYKWVDFFF